MDTAGLSKVLIVSYVVTAQSTTKTASNVAKRFFWVDHVWDQNWAIEACRL